MNSGQTCGGIPSSQIPNNSFGYGRVDALAAVNSPRPGHADADRDPRCQRDLDYRADPHGHAPPSATSTTGPSATAAATQTPGGPSATAAPPTATATAPAATHTPARRPRRPAPSPSAMSSRTDYFYTPVQYLACHGVICGYADGTFRPYNQTTRGQMVKIVVLGFAVPGYTAAEHQHVRRCAADAIPSSAVIEAAAHANIVSGYACGSAPAEPCDARTARTSARSPT